VTSRQFTASEWAKVIQHWDRLAEEVQRIRALAADHDSGREGLAFLVGGWSAIELLAEGADIDAERLDRLVELAAQSMATGVAPHIGYAEDTPIRRAFQDAGVPRPRRRHN
jgi:uncharacterized protein (UPF0276 family)